jgi:GRIP domain
MKDALLSRDGDLATAEKAVGEFQNQVEELCRVRRREDVNLDYLKGVVVQYLSKPPGTSERARLLPVLATLLQVRFRAILISWHRLHTTCSYVCGCLAQFDSEDYRMIEEGKKKLSWWGTVEPILIGQSAPTPTPATSSTWAAAPLAQTQSTSAEVSISSAAPPSSGIKKTSLQF